MRSKIYCHMNLTQL